MKSENIVRLAGKLSAEPQGFITKSNLQGCRLRIATTEERQTNSTGARTVTQWHRVTCFGPAAVSALEKLAEGHFVQVEGRLQYSTYRDTRDEKRFGFDIIARSVHLVSSEPMVDPSDEPEKVPESAAA